VIAIHNRNGGGAAGLLRRAPSLSVPARLLIGEFVPALRGIYSLPVGTLHPLENFSCPNHQLAADVKKYLKYRTEDDSHA
jgi:hypothetical protein